MCGLAGTLLAENISEQQLDQVRTIFIDNLLANEKRGPKATGVVVSQADGAVYALKRPVPASVFVASAEFEAFMKRHLNTTTRILLGHTREPTKGTVLDHVNNHPILVGDTVGVHNGVISNDDAIFVKLAKDNKELNRIGAVDSEAIFALFDGVDGDLSLAEYVDGIARGVGMLCGSFTTLFFNKKKPTRLFCLRYNNPISCHFDRALNCLFFSSRYIFLRKTFGRSVISEPMPGRTGFVFEAAMLAQNEKKPSYTFPLEATA